MSKLIDTSVISISWRLLRDVIGRFPALTAAGIVSSLLASNLPLVANAAQGTVINSLIDPNRTDNTILYLAAAAFITLSLLGGFAASLNVWFRERIYRISQRYFTTRYLAQVSSLETQHFTNPEVNDVLKQAGENYHWRPQQLYDDLVEFLSSGTQLLGSMFIILAFSPIFGLILIISILPGLWVRMRLTARAWSIWDADTHTRRLFESASTHMSEIDSVTELRLFGARNYLLDLVHQIFTGFFNREAKQAEKKALLTSLTSLFSDAVIAVFWVYGLTLVIDGTIDLGYFTFLAATALIMRNALDSLRWILMGTLESAKYMQSYYKLMDLQPITIGGDIKAIEAPPAIEFQNVKFQYPFKGDVALQGVNLKIEPGEKVAFVGENGAGKSTLIKLLLRMYDPNEGVILVNGKNLKDYDVATWHRQFGVLFQNFSRFNFLNAQHSIGIGDSTRMDDAEGIKLAAEKSQADKFISQLEHGYAQVLNPAFDKGTDLSGGQWQRIALARAFFRDAPVLILDEPTSAIDAQGEYEIFERLYEFAGNKTVIIISHRFSTVRRADRIFVVAEGKITESGTHAELLALKGQYADSFNKQAEGYK